MRTDRDSYVVLLQVEQVAQLATFSEALLEYHQQCTEVLRGLTETLLEKYVRLYVSGAKLLK